MSVFVEFDRWGRMGNRMFQIAFGYCLSRHKNCKLYHPSLPNFGIISNINEGVAINPLYTRAFGDNYVNYDTLLSTDKDIIVNSFVQKHYYYQPFREELKKFFNTKDATINKDKLVVHIRETDYVEIKTFLGYDFYRKMIDDSGFKDIIIVTDNSNCDTVKRLVSEGCKLNTEGYVNKFEHHCDTRGMVDFATLLHSENIAISQSSFSWWAAFLGNHNKIIIPYKKDGGMWKITPGQDDGDLCFNDSSVIKYIL